MKTLRVITKLTKIPVFDSVKVFSSYKHDVTNVLPQHSTSAWLVAAKCMNRFGFVNSFHYFSSHTRLD